MHSFQEIHTHELHPLLDNPNMTLVDVRNDDEVAFGIIQHAIHIPLHEIPAKLGKIPQTDKIIFYCRSGVRSAQAANYAMNNGLQHCYNLIGGVIAWQKDGFVLTQKP